MSFSDFKQQAAVAGQLQRGLQRGRLAHAYLFLGPRGSGKEALARQLAKALNCGAAPADSCDECDSCGRVAKGTHPDVYFVRPESKSRRITVEQVKDFMKSVGLRSTMGGVKVGIIVDADCMGDEASNAFLKTLEEPPAQTVILLLSAEPQRLLPTILSRCLRISLGAGVTRTESPYRTRVVGLLAEFSARGPERVARAYGLLAELTKILAELRGATRKRVEEGLNVDQYAELDAKVREKLEEQAEARVEGEYRAGRELLLEEMYRWFCDVMLRVEGVAEGLLAQADFAEASRRVAAGLTHEQASENLAAVEQMRDALQRNIAEPLALEVGLLKLTQ